MVLTNFFFLRKELSFMSERPDQIIKPGGVDGHLATFD